MEIYRNGYVKPVYYRGVITRLKGIRFMVKPANPVDRESSQAVNTERTSSAMSSKSDTSHPLSPFSKIPFSTSTESTLILEVESQAPYCSLPPDFFDRALAASLARGTRRNQPVLSVETWDGRSVFAIEDLDS